MVCTTAVFNLIDFNRTLTPCGRVPTKAYSFKYDPMLKCGDGAVINCSQVITGPKKTIDNVYVLYGKSDQCLDFNDVQMIVRDRVDYSGREKYLSASEACGPSCITAPPERTDTKFIVNHDMEKYAISDAPAHAHHIGVITFCNIMNPCVEYSLRYDGLRAIYNPCDSAGDSFNYLICALQKSNSNAVVGDEMVISQCPLNISMLLVN